MKINNRKGLHVLLIIVDLMIVLAISELWIRIFVPVKNVEYFVDPDIGVRYKPNQKNYGHVEKGYANVMRTNAIGTYDINRKKEKRDDTYRIHIYGDSLVAGLGVSMKDTIPSIIQGYIKKDLPDKNIEVFNMASGAESTTSQLMTYRKIGKKYGPDLVICIFDEDFADNVLFLSGNKYAPYYTLDENGELLYHAPAARKYNEFLSKIKRRWFRTYRLAINKLVQTKLYNDSKNTIHLLNYKIKNFLNPKQKVASSSEKRDIVCHIYKTQGWPITLKVIKMFNDEVEKDGSKFIFVDAKPFKSCIKEVHNHSDLKKFCKKNKIIYINLYDEVAYINQANNMDNYLLSDGHPNSKGNQLLAESLYQNILPEIRKYIFR